jgi:TolB protein
MSQPDSKPYILIIDSDGTNLVRLTQDQSNNDYPIWTTDGKHILFVSNRSGTNEIYIMNPDGSDVQAITKGLDVDLQRVVPVIYYGGTGQ